MRILLLAHAYFSARSCVFCRSLMRALPLAHAFFPAKSIEESIEDFSKATPYIYSAPMYILYQSGQLPYQSGELPYQSGELFYQSGELPYQSGVLPVELPVESQDFPLFLEGRGQRDPAVFPLLSANKEFNVKGISIYQPEAMHPKLKIHILYTVWITFLSTSIGK